MYNKKIVNDCSLKMPTDNYGKVFKSATLQKDTEVFSSGGVGAT